MEKSNELSLSNIKKVITVSTGYTSEGIDRCRRNVNKLLDVGWILLGVQKCDYGEPKVVKQNVTYHLGHTEPQAETFEDYDFSTERLKESVGKSLS